MVTQSLTSPPPGACDSIGKLKRADGASVGWIISEGLTDYPEGLETMKAHAAAVAAGDAREAVWLVEHPPLYTSGTSARETDLLAPERFPVYAAGRGGQFTYHGPGQRVVYLMLDLKERGRDIRCFVQGLEGWIIDTLAAFNIRGERREGQVGVWVARPERGPGRYDKIAALGVRVSRWVSFHGVSINIAPDLGHYAGIVPCGITDQGITSLEDLGQLVAMPEFDGALRRNFERRFGPAERAAPEALVSGP